MQEYHLWWKGPLKVMVNEKGDAGSDCKGVVTGREKKNLGKIPGKLTRLGGVLRNTGKFLGDIQRSWRVSCPPLVTDASSISCVCEELYCYCYKNSSELDCARCLTLFLVLWCLFLFYFIIFFFFPFFFFFFFCEVRKCGCRGTRWPARLILASVCCSFEV